MTKREIENLKSSARIEDVAGRYTKLVRKGKNYTALCPFHDDHHPSLVVDVAKQTFHCFACGEHGDVIGFVQKAEHCGFTEAVAKLSGSSLPSVDLHKTEKKTTTKKPASAAPTLTDAQKQQFLASLMPYACGHSELTPAYLDFEVGQSPCQVPKEWKSMGNRIVFPIRDEAGSLVAFGARRLTDNNPDDPKYINTSVAGGYKKSEHLYGLFRAKEAIAQRGFAYVVEGYKDALAMHAAGLTNTVALCGTALSEQQAALLNKHAGMICLLLDGDKAGRDAARRIQLSQVTELLEVKTLYLPEGEDPDSLFRRHGREVFAALIERYRMKPDFSEELLLTACLTYSDTFYMFNGSLCLFTKVLDCVLRTDNLLFENDDYRAILAFLAKGDAEDRLDEVLMGVADSLHAAYDTILEEDLEAFKRLYASQSDYLEKYLIRLLFLYTEQRILKDIHTRVRQLLTGNDEDVDLRMEILIRIASRREQLRHVAYNLDRPGAEI